MGRRGDKGRESYMSKEKKLKMGAQWPDLSEVIKGALTKDI